MGHGISGRTEMAVGEHRVMAASDSAMTIERRARSGSIAAATSFLLNLAQSIVAAPVLLTFWSAELYGIWTSVLAANALLISLDTGHQNFLGNAINRLWIEDKASVAKVVRSGVLAAVGIASVEC